MQMDLFPETLVLESVDPARNRARFYRMDVLQDLFGMWTLVRRWGRIGTTGREAMRSYASPGLALDAMGAVARQKRRRGYGERL